MCSEWRVFITGVAHSVQSTITILYMCVKGPAILEDVLIEVFRTLHTQCRTELNLQNQSPFSKDHTHLSRSACSSAFLFPLLTVVQVWHENECLDVILAERGGMIWIIYCHLFIISHCGDDFTFCFSKLRENKKTAELIKTANLLFNSFEPYYMWDYIARWFEECCRCV